MTGSAPLAARLRARLEALGVGPRTPLVVAVSGGLDSVVLLHLLRFGVGGAPARLVVAHFDHRMRPESPADARWVKGLGRAWGLRVEVGVTREPLRAETDARAARWAFLDDVRRGAGAEWVVTAHHRDDQAETVLHHLMRGAGLRGLAGIRPAAGTRLRPLLTEPRAELHRWAQTAGLAWRTDATNSLAIGPRNRLRWEVLPLLEAIRPGAAGAVARTAAIAAADDEALVAAETLLLEGRVRRVRPGRLDADLAELRAFPPPLLSRLLRRLATEVGAPLDAAATRAALDFTLAGPGGGETRLPPGLTLRRSLGRLEVEGPRVGRLPPDRVLRVERPFEGGAGEAVIGGERWGVVWGPVVPPTVTWSATLPDDPPGSGFLVRGWREGDRLDGRPVARLWSRAGVPRQERRRRPVVESGGGRLLWVPGSARSTALDEEGVPRYQIGISHVAPG